MFVEKKKVFPAIFCFSKTVKAIDACLGQLRWSKIKQSKIKVKPFSNFARDRCSAAHEKLPWEQGRFGLKWPASLFSTEWPKYFWKSYLKSYLNSIECYIFQNQIPSEFLGVVHSKINGTCNMLKWQFWFKKLI